MKIKLLFLTLMFVLSNSALAINKCDELAAAPDNQDNPQNIKGVKLGYLQAKPAITACLKALNNEPNNPRFQHQLGRAYNKNKNYTDAIKWYEKATKKNYVVAQYELGVMHQRGEGIKQNYKSAVMWLTKAAEQEYAQAQYNLGVMYYNGYGVAKNKLLAIEWLKKSARSGQREAQKVLQNLGKTW